jgi:hypothetical protein
LGVVENVRAVRRDVLAPERRPDELVPEPPVEIPATADLGLLPKERPNLLDIVDPRAVCRSAYRRQALRPDDELTVRQPLQAARPKEMETQRSGAH